MDLIQQVTELPADASVADIQTMQREVSARRMELEGKPGGGITVAEVEAERAAEIEAESLRRCYQRLAQVLDAARQREAVEGFDDAKAELLTKADAVESLERQLAEARAELAGLSKAFEQRRRAGGKSCAVDGDLGDRVAALVHPEPGFAPDQRARRATVRRQLCG